MKKSLAVLIGGSLISLGVNAAPSCNDIKGAWINDLGSTLTISEVSTDGSIKGTYSSPSGTSGETFPLVGWTNHAAKKPDIDNVRVVSFSVNWGKYGSVTSWSGGCATKDGKPTISTIWNLVRSNSQFDWDHILTNSDVFTPK